MYSFYEDDALTLCVSLAWTGSVFAHPDMLLAPFLKQWLTTTTTTTTTTTAADASIITITTATALHM